MEALQPFLSLAVVVLYLVPTMLAAVWNKRMTGWIFLLNLLLGWTVVGWIGAMAWAVMDRPAPRPIASGEAPKPPPSTPVASGQSSSGASALVSTEAAPVPSGVAGDVLELGAKYIVRVGPEMTARSTGELRKGTRVSVVHTNGDWAWVKADDGQEGWIALKR